MAIASIARSAEIPNLMTQFEPRAGLAIAAGVMALAACSPDPNSAAQKAADDRAVAQVEAIQRQKPPPRAINPQPILFADIQKFNLFGAGCAFAPGDSMGAVLLTRAKAGFIKLGDGMVRFAADPGSAALPLDPRAHYVGKAMSLSLTRSDTSGDDDLRSGDSSLPR